jgi:hypothetical protein|tara:strand:+ start:669 stop:1088 length:420 start_codon:yes stop_codon:yes gene_type:complete
MATLTSTAAASGVPPRATHVGVNSASWSFNSGATDVSISATTILMGKIPSGATILDVVQQHSTGAASCPMDIGVDTDLDALATAATQAVWSRATAGVPFDVDASGTVTAGFQYVKATVTPASVTASVKVNLTVLYTMDK